MFKFNVSDIAPLPEEPESDGSQGNTDTDGKTAVNIHSRFMRRFKQ
jgi:hypothetical protein